MAKTTKIIIWIVIVLAIIWIGVNWGGGDKAPVSNEPIKIGAIYALTGPAAQFGEISAKGVRGAVDYFKEVEKVEVELFLEDSANDPKQGVSAAQKIFNIDKVKFAVVGTSGITAAISPLADQYEAVLITDAAGYGLTKDRKFLFQNLLPSLNDVAIQINNNSAWRKLAIVYINDEFGSIWNQKISDNIVDKEVKSFPFSKDVKDFRTDSLKIKEFSPDVIFVLGYGPALNQVHADLAAQKLSAKMISYLSCTLPGVLTDTRYSLEGNYSYEYPAVKNEPLRNWIINHGGQLNTFYLLAFENTLLAIEAAKSSNSNSLSALEYLKSQTASLLFGPVSFNENNVSERDLQINLIKGAKCEPVNL